MYSVPDEFADRLSRDFQGRLRTRWSKAKAEWHIEERVGRGCVAPTRHRDPHDRSRWLPVEVDDAFIRARDGYAYVMSIRPGDRMPCPTCGLTLKVPVLHTGETICANCVKKGRDGHWKAAYYPLGEGLLEHLRKIDPESDGVRRAALDADLANQQREAGLERSADGALHDGLMDVAIDQLPTFGYSSQTTMWES